MSSMFHGASNIHISGSPSFTMINGGYHHYDSSTQTQSSQTANLGGTTFANHTYESPAPEQDRSSARRERKTPSSHGPTRNTGIRINPYVIPAALPSLRALPKPPTQVADFQPWEVQQITQDEMHELMGSLAKKAVSNDDEEALSSRFSRRGLSDVYSQSAIPKDGRRGGITREGFQTSVPGSRSYCEVATSANSAKTTADEATNLGDAILPSPSLSDEETYGSAFHAEQDTLKEDQEIEEQSHSKALSNPPVVPPHVVRMLRELHLSEKHGTMSGYV